MGAVTATEDIHHFWNLSSNFDHLFTRVCYIDKNPVMSDKQPKSGLEDPNPLDVCKALKALLDESKISIAELNRRTGIPVTTLTHWTTDTEPRPTDIYKIEKACKWAPTTVLVRAGLALQLDASRISQILATAEPLTPPIQRLAVETWWLWVKLSSES